jgi:hypothetical protein
MLSETPNMKRGPNKIPKFILNVCLLEVNQTNQKD